MLLGDILIVSSRLDGFYVIIIVILRSGILSLYYKHLSLKSFKILLEIGIA